MKAAKPGFCDLRFTDIRLTIAVVSTSATVISEGPDYSGNGPFIAGIATAQITTVEMEKDFLCEGSCVVWELPRIILNLYKGSSFHRKDAESAARAPIASARHLPSLRPRHKNPIFFAVIVLSLSLSFEIPAQENDAPLLQANEPIRRELSKGETHSHRIALEAGQYVRALVEQSGPDLVMMLYAPGGQRLIERNTRQRGATPLSLIAEATGVYRLELLLNEEDAASGRYELKMEGTRAATAQDNNRIAAEETFAAGERLQAEWKTESSRKAIRKFKDASASWQTAGDTREEADALAAIGEIYHSLSEFGESLEHYKRAAGLIQGMKEIRLEGEILNGLGYAHLHLGDNPKALEYCARALQLSRVANDLRGEIRALNNVGEVYYYYTNMQESLKYYEQAMPLCVNSGDRRGLAHTLMNFGYTYSFLSDTEKAFDSYNRALAIFRAAGNRRWEALALIAIGHLHSRLGEKQEALDIFNRALPLIRIVGDRIWQGSALSGIAYIYDGFGEEGKALNHYKQALALFQAVGYPKGESGTLHRIGRAYHSLGDNISALDSFEKALSVSRASADQVLISRALDDLGVVHDSMGNKAKALDYYNQALSINQAVKDKRGAAHTLNNIGNVYESLKERRKALDYYNRALLLNREAEDRFGEVSTLYHIARVKRDLGDLAEARARIEETFNKVESLRTDVFSQELRASYLAAARRNYELYIDVLMLMRKERPLDGLDAYALHISERARARSLLELLVESRADIGKGVDPALLERRRLLQEQLSGKAERQARLLAGKHTAQEAAALAEEINALASEHQQVRAQIRAASPRYAALIEPQPLNLKEIQQHALDSDTLLIEYVLGDDRSYLWAVTADSMAGFELPGRAEIETAARRVYELLTAPNRIIGGETARQKQKRLAQAEADYNDAAARLSRLVLGPVASLLEAKRLLIVADGALQFIPFSALPQPVAGSQWSEVSGQRQSDGQRTTDSYQPLILNHEIVSLPSASTLAVLRREFGGRDPAPKAIAVLADPVFSEDDPRLKRASARRVKDGSAQSAMGDVRASRQGGRLERLPFSRKEAEAILAFAPVGETLKAVGFDANRAAAMSAELSRYRIIHFATHGVLDSAHPELSGIALSLIDEQGRPQDGFLRLHEISDMKLAAELVVLSACQTGLGKEIRGEGIEGLARGFMYAGAERVISSLWKVDDAATAELMERFYSRMLKQRQRPAAALRAAQMEMWKQPLRQSPYYWAAFTLQGEWR